MELYFCSECQGSIPLGEVESGAATGPDGQHYCAEHRPAADASEDAPEGEFELLFCSNCRVSIPQTDAKSGRARKQYGSLMCAVCSKADPGERAARREAVEAEMTADLDENDPLADFRAVPVAAAAPPVASGAPSGERNSSFAVLVVLVFGACLVAGVAGGSLLLREEAPPPSTEWKTPVAELRESIQDLNDELAKVRSQNSDLRAALEKGLDDTGRGIEARLAQRQADLSDQLAGLATRSDAATRQLAEKAAKHEGMLTQLSEQVKALTASMSERRPPVKDDGGADDTGGGMQPPVDPPPTSGSDVVAPPDPKVTQLCNDLLDESQDDSVRFPAATELGRLGDPAAIPYLARALLTDKHFLVRRACARSLGNLKAWNSTPMLIQALQDKEAYVAQQASFALQTITGQDWGVTQEQALGERKRRAREAGRWWEKNEANPPDGVSVHTAQLPQ